MEVCSSSLKHLNSDYQLMPRVFGLTGQAMISKEKEHETGLPYKSSGRIHTCGIRSSQERGGRTLIMVCRYYYKTAPFMAGRTLFRRYP